MSDTYILKGHETVLCDSLLEWGKKFTQTDRHVAVDEQGEVQVSTVFLGLDHQYGEGPPLLFETMVFGGSQNGECYRYTTWKEAEEGHKKVCKEIFKKKSSVKIFDREINPKTLT